MRILLTGKKGQLGWELERALCPLGGVCAFDRRELDVSDEQTIARVISEVRPDVIVNAAAYTAVDRAEGDAQAAERINARAPAVLAEQAKLHGALLVHYSTDYVFDGGKAAPYIEADATNPLNVYGRSKLAGERAVLSSGASHLILRTTWIYAARGRNFLRTIVRLGAECETLKVVNDQFGAPTSARLVADATAHAVRKARSQDISGTFHVTCAGLTTWHGFASWILDYAGNRLRAREIESIPTAAYATAAKRPANSSLDCTLFEKTFDVLLPPWEHCANLVLQEVFPPGA